jgi:hypothetical protein
MKNIQLGIAAENLKAGATVYFKGSGFYKTDGNKSAEKTEAKPAPAETKKAEPAPAVTPKPKE